MSDWWMCLQKVAPPMNKMSVFSTASNKMLL